MGTTASMDEENVRYLWDCVERLRLAREALVATGYFTTEQVGDDVAPRITELWVAACRGEITPTDGR